MSADIHAEHLINQFYSSWQALETAEWVLGDQNSLAIWFKENLGRLLNPGGHSSKERNPVDSVISNTGKRPRERDSTGHEEGRGDIRKHRKQHGALDQTTSRRTNRSYPEQASDDVIAHPDETTSTTSDSSSWTSSSVDLLQVLEDVLLDHSPNDLSRFVSNSVKGELDDDILYHTESPIETLILSIRKCSWKAINFLRNAAEKTERSEKHGITDSETEHLTRTLTDVLKNLFQVNCPDLGAVNIRQTLSTLYEVLDVPKSKINRERNKRIIQSHLDSPIKSNDIYRGLRGVQSISTTPIHGIDSILATNGWYFYMGMLALSRSRFRFDSSPRTDYLDFAISFFSFDLEYDTDSWETWYRLAQCHETKAMTSSKGTPPLRRAIHCYILAIASAQRTLHTPGSLKKLSLLYHDFGISTCHLMPLIQSHWPLDQFSTWKLAASMFRRATICFNGRWISHFMLATCTYRICEAKHHSESHDPGLEIDYVLRALKRAFHALSRSPETFNGRESRFDVHQEITSMMKWLIERRDTYPERVRVFLNYSIAVLLSSRGSFHMRAEALPRLLQSNPETNEMQTGSLATSPKPNTFVIKELPVTRTESRIETPPTGIEATLSEPNTFVNEELPVPRTEIRIKQPPTGIQAPSPDPNTLIDDKIRDLSNLSPEEVIQLGLLCEQQLKIKQSIACFNYLTHCQPKSVRKETWWLKVAPMLEQSGKLDQAKKMYKLVLERNSENAKAMQHLGRLYHQENPSRENQDRAIGYLERSVAFDKSNAQSWYLLGCSYLSRQWLPKAHEAFQQAIHRDRKNVDCWASLGALNVKLKRYGEAQNAYDTAIQLDRMRVESWVNMGNLMRQIDKIPKAIDNFKTAASLDPSNAEVQKYLQELIDVC